MLKFRLVSALALLAATAFLATLAGCGGASTTHIIVPPPVSGPHHAQVILFPVIKAGDPNFNDFMSNILPNVSGVAVSMKWNEIETSQGSYDFSAYDANLAPYIAAGRTVNLIVWPATEGGNNDPATSGSTPAYVFTQAWANSVGAPTPQDMAVCASYEGDSGNPFFNSEGVWNITRSGDLSGLPVSYELPFMKAYQNFIAAVIAHYNGNATTPIGYIRFGFSQGGENSPLCNQDPWPNYSKSTYLKYIQTMTQFVAQQNPQMTILEDLHAVGVPPNQDLGYADTEAQDAVNNSMGFGTNGLQQSDITNSASGQPCDSDWCALFAQYAGTTFNGKPITLSLQTLQWSDPTKAQATGSLSDLLPFIVQHGTNNVELYLADAALAFSPNYLNYPHSDPSFTSFAGAYKQAIQTYLGAQ